MRVELLIETGHIAGEPVVVSGIVNVRVSKSVDVVDSPLPSSDVPLDVEDLHESHDLQFHQEESSSLQS